uniref:Uncharacterized protein n=1 Tax=Rhizophora mucronata TaxID=61149 RepID=A0A2P2KY52_RHIMU
MNTLFPSVAICDIIAQIAFLRLAFWRDESYICARLCNCRICVSCGIVDNINSLEVKESLEIVNNILQLCCSFETMSTLALGFTYCSIFIFFLFYPFQCILMPICCREI